MIDRHPVSLVALRGRRRDRVSDHRRRVLERPILDGPAQPM